MGRLENEEFLIGYVFLLSNKLNQIGDSILPDITFKQFMLLILISKMEDKEKSIHEIAKAFGTTRQNVKKMIVSLETKGYCIVEKSERDARALKVELTEKAYREMSDNHKATIYETDRLFASLSDDEINGIISSLIKFMDCLERYPDKKR